VRREEALDRRLVRSRDHRPRSPSDGGRATDPSPAPGMESPPRHRNSVAHEASRSSGATSTSPPGLDFRGVRSLTPPIARPGGTHVDEIAERGAHGGRERLHPHVGPGVGASTMTASPASVPTYSPTWSTAVAPAFGSAASLSRRRPSQSPPSPSEAVGAMAHSPARTPSTRANDSSVPTSSSGQRNHAHG
jgi:hypothetical protein